LIAVILYSQGKAMCSAVNFSGAVWDIFNTAPFKSEVLKKNREGFQYVGELPQK
jgi:hypothetical protein